jgi:hypothetical protein
VAEKWKARVLLHPDGEREFTPGSEREETELVTGHGYRVKDAKAKKAASGSGSGSGSTGGTGQGAGT